MRKALALPISALAVTLAAAACTGEPSRRPIDDPCLDVICEDGFVCNPGTGVCDPPDGTAGTGGIDEGCLPGCEAGTTCEGEQCLPDYTISFVDPPDQSGARVRLVLEVRPRSGHAAIDPARIEIAATLSNVDLEVPELGAVEGQDNRWELDFDLTHAGPASDHAARLSVTASLNRMAIDPVSRSVVIDTKPPELDMETLVAKVFRRDEPVSFRVTMSEPHAQGSRVFAYLTGGDQRPPPPPIGWIEGTYVEGTMYVFSFSIDQRVPLTELTGMTGELKVHLWAADLYGNEAQVQPSKGVIQVTRKGWEGDMAARLDTAPVIMRDGKLAVLVTKTIGVFDMVTAAKVSLNVANVSTPIGLVQGEDGGLYIAEPLALQRAQVQGSKLQDPPAMRCSTSKAVAAMPALARVDGSEVAFVSLDNGTFAMIAPTSATTCNVVVTRRLDNAGYPGSAIPAVTIEDGKPVVFVGGQTQESGPKSTLTVWTATDASTLTPLNELAPTSFEVLRGAGLAIDGRTVTAGALFKKMMASFQFSDFATQPIEKVKFLESTPPIESMGAPIVTQTAVVFPTDKGLRALPRTGPWSQTAIFPPETAIPLGETAEFRSTPVAGEGDVVYAVSKNGFLYALHYTEDPIPKFIVSWKTQLGTGETFTAPLTLNCNGVLVASAESGKIYTVVADSLGLDSLAPWPKFQHDLQNTGNTSTPTACSK